MRLIFPASMPLNDRLTYESFNILSFTINGFSVTCSSTNNAVEEQSPDISRKDTDLRLFRILFGLGAGIFTQLLKFDAIIKGPAYMVCSRIIRAGRHKISKHPFDMFFRLEICWMIYRYRFDTRMKIAETVQDNSMAISQLFLHDILQCRKYSKGICFRSRTSFSNHFCKFCSMKNISGIRSCKPFTVPGRMTVINNLIKFIFYAHSD